MAWATEAAWIELDTLGEWPTHAAWSYFCWGIFALEYVLYLSRVYGILLALCLPSQQHEGKEEKPMYTPVPLEALVNLGGLILVSSFSDWANENGYYLPTPNSKECSALVDRITEYSAKEAPEIIAATVLLLATDHKKAMGMLSSQMTKLGRELAQRFSAEGHLSKVSSESLN